MSTEAIQFPLNSAENTGKIQKEIKALEIQLESALVAFQDAQRLVKRLTKTIKKHKASVSPIHLLPNEILSSIFELCALDDWKSALRIGCVSRHLRNAILNTPRAWIFIHVDERKEISDLYFERSGQCRLHVRLSTGIALPKEVAHRIKCMTAEDLNGSDPATIFSSLVRLRVQEMVLLPKISEITTTSFPLLCHLDLSNEERDDDYPAYSLFIPFFGDRRFIPPSLGEPDTPCRAGCSSLAPNSESLQYEPEITAPQYRCRS